MTLILKHCTPAEIFYLIVHTYVAIVFRVMKDKAQQIVPWCRDVFDSRPFIWMYMSPVKRMLKLVAEGLCLKNML